ncbi:adenine methylase [Vibrio phage vB_VpP_1]|nr:adenine methylase [Vibrio phage vB_VpP_1]
MAIVRNLSNHNKKYKVIYADPAWQFSSKKTGGSMKSGAGQKYTVTSIDDMKKLPIKELADQDCLLVMWWVGAMPQEAIDLVKAWGFKLCNMNGFVWDKETVHGKDFFGMGHITRASTESAITAYRGKLKNLIVDRSVRSRIRAKVGKHSEKPHEFRLAIEKLCGEVERIELFSRVEKPGWDAWGNHFDKGAN